MTIHRRMPGHRRIAIGLALTILGAGGMAMLLFPAVQRGREPAARVTSLNNLRQIGLACHNYHDTYQYFPSENAPPASTAKLSWRVQILPYIEENDLYEKFHQDEPWDSPHNIKLLPRMPKLYMDPRFQSMADQEKGLTYYRGFAGPGGVLGGQQPVSIVFFPGAASNIVLVVEAGEPEPWTKPEDRDFNENSPLGGPKRVNFAALFMDGHVQTLPQNFDRKMIGRMINWQNTEPVTLPPPEVDPFFSETGQ